MKQPKNIMFSEQGPTSEEYTVYIDSDFLVATIGYGLTEKAAYKAAARRLRKLANEAERRAK